MARRLEDVCVCRATIDFPSYSSSPVKHRWEDFVELLSEPSQSLATLVTNSLTHCCLVDLVDDTLACEDANSKLVEAVTVAEC